MSDSKTFLWLTLVALGCCHCSSRPEQNTLFTAVPNQQAGILFENELKEDSLFNIIEYLYLYNGGGVALGDINNDGLPEVYLSSNQDSNRLYLNKGNWQFEDITSRAGVAGAGNWKTGVSMVDVDGDGWLDIFMCGVGQYKQFNGRNQLLMNNRDNTFREATNESGLSFSGFSTQASFFDYDLDGDLDMYLANHSVHSPLTYGKASNRLKSDSLAGDRLYRNELNQSGILRFTDVTKAAGIYNSAIGYGLSVGVGDLNLDGYPDLYVSNDFSENDYLYLNNKNGTFTEQGHQAFAHTSRFSMGNDIADINNDGRPDLVTLDMRPYNESVIKTSGGEDAYEIWKFKQSYGFHTQVSRNTVQINQGLLDDGGISFSDVAQLSAMDATDWSWCPLIFDADGDGYKDLFISNGIVRRPNNMDYIAFISSDSSQMLMRQGTLPWVKLMPEGSEANFFFQGSGGIQFKNVSQAWGLTGKDFSTGAAYGDLDGDGDPDLVINRINSPALLLQNQTKPNSYLSVSLLGPAGNSVGVGAKVRVEQNGKVQHQELFPSRGWQSSSSATLHFGVASGQPVSLTVTWPDGKITRQNVIGTSVRINYTKAQPAPKNDSLQPARLLQRWQSIDYVHRENEFSPFSRETLMPFSMAELGPAIAVSESKAGDTDMIFMGAGGGQQAKLFTLTNANTWAGSSDLSELEYQAEDTDAIFIDYDGDQDNDLLVVAGGGEKLNDRSLVPRLYVNQNNKFKLTKGLVPEISLNASCIKPCDFDSDGDIDIFIGGAVMPYLYGMPPPSYLWENVGGRFIINQIWAIEARFDSPVPNRPGMVTDAAWADVNHDNRPDLIMVGQWMPITVLVQNEQHKFFNKTHVIGLKTSHGLWNTIESNDLDQDGDLDFVVGNLGLNSRLKASWVEPLELYVGDFDSNRGSDQILAYYNGGVQYPFVTRDQLIKQIPAFKRKFLRYEDFKNAKLQDIITPIQLGNAALLKATVLASSVLFQEKDSLRLVPLPVEAQLSAMHACVILDINGDKLADIILAGNQTEVQPEIGPYDASPGCVLLGMAKGDFRAAPFQESGFYVRGNTRTMKLIKNANDHIILVGRNNDSVLSFLVKPPL